MPQNIPNAGFTTMSKKTKDAKNVHVTTDRRQRMAVNRPNIRGWKQQALDSALKALTTAAPGAYESCSWTKRTGNSCARSRCPPRTKNRECSSTSHHFFGTKKKAQRPSWIPAPVKQFIGS